MQTKNLTKGHWIQTEWCKSRALISTRVNFGYKQLRLWTQRSRLGVLCFCSVPPADLQRADLHYLYIPRQITQSAREKDGVRERGRKPSLWVAGTRGVKASQCHPMRLVTCLHGKAKELMKWLHSTGGKDGSRGGGGFWCGVWCCLQILALLNTLLRCHGKIPYTLTRMEGKENK